MDLTARLDRGMCYAGRMLAMHKILRSLWPIVFEEEHCITSCAEDSTGPSSVGHSADTAIPQGVQWYDEPTRQKVLGWFLHDFASFNFSRTPPADIGSTW